MQEYIFEWENEALTYAPGPGLGKRASALSAVRPLREREVTGHMIIWRHSLLLAFALSNSPIITPNSSSLIQQIYLNKPLPALYVPDIPS